MMKRAIRDTLLFPSMYFLYIAIISIHEGMNLLIIPIRYGLELLVLSLYPARTMFGYMLSTHRLGRLTPIDYIVAPLMMIVFWVIASRILMLVWKQFRTFFNMKQQVVIGCIFIVGVSIWTLYPLLPTPSTATVTVDLSQSLGQLTNHHRGFSQGGEWQMTEAGYFEGAMTQMAEINPKLVRIDHIYDYYDVMQDDGDYHWDELDRVVDAIYLSGAEPFMSISYTPQNLAKNGVYGPPNDLAVWEELVYQTVYHFNVERGLDIRYWEVWNEPNLRKFWSGTIDDYMTLYETTVRGVLRADSSVFVGGMGLSSVRGFGKAGEMIHTWDWVHEFVDYVNKHNIQVDFFSWHLYSRNPKDYAASIKLYQDWLKDINLRPMLFLTEWNFDAGFVPELDTGETSAYIVATIATLNDTALDQAFFFEPIDNATEWQGHWGMMRADNVVKPAFNVYRLLDMLEGERLALTSDHPNIYGIAALNDEWLSIAIGNYDSGHDEIQITLNLIDFPTSSELEAEIYGVDSVIGNTYVDVANMDLMIGTLPIENDDLQISIPNNGMRLIRIKTTIMTE